MPQFQNGHSGKVGLYNVQQAVAACTISDDGNVLLPRLINPDWRSQCALPVTAWLNDSTIVPTAGDESRLLSWDDATGCGYGATPEVTLQDNVIVMNSGWSDGTKCVQFNAGMMSWNNAGPLLDGTAKKSLLVHFRPLAFNLQGILGRSNGAQAEQYYQFGWDMGIVERHLENVDCVADTDVLACFSESPGAGNSSMWANGRRTMIAADASAVPTAVWNKVRLGGALNAVGGLFYPWSARVKQVAIINGEMNADTWHQLEIAILGRPFANIIFTGNSLTQGTFEPIGAFPTRVKVIMGQTRGRCFIENLGRGGWDTAMLLATIDQDLTAYRRNTARNICVFWEVSNDIDANHPCLTLEDTRNSARTVVDNAWRYVAEARARGYEVIVMTPLNRTVVAYTANQTLCQQMACAIMRDEWRKVGAVDCISLDQIPACQNPADTTWFRDGVHETKALTNLIAQVVAARLIARLEGGTP